MEEKTFDKLFNKYDALNMNETTTEQRRNVHALFEKLGGYIACTTEVRDNIIRQENPWSYHLYIDTEYSNRPQLRGTLKDITFVYKMKFKPYEWWIPRLSGKKCFDNTADSSTDTYLDQQLKTI